MTFDPPAADPPATGRPGNGLIGIALLIGVLMIGGVIFLIARGAGSSTADYRDPATLASAVGDAYGGRAACGQASAGGYLCAVARADGSEGLYRIAVSDDGRTWSAAG